MDLSVCVFWMLLATGLLVLAACIITPSWVKCKKLDQQELAVNRHLEQLRKNSLDRAQAIAAAQTDVAFNERLLIEELNYRRPGEQALVTVSAARPSWLDPQSNSNTVRNNPARFEVFAQPDTRNILLAMSCGLLLFAFIYYRPTNRTGRLPEVPIRPTPARFVR